MIFVLDLDFIILTSFCHTVCEINRIPSSQSLVPSDRLTTPWPLLHTYSRDISGESGFCVWFPKDEFKEGSDKTNRRLISSLWWVWQGRHTHVPGKRTSQHTSKVTDIFLKILSSGKEPRILNVTSGCSLWYKRSLPESLFLSLTSSPLSRSIGLKEVYK